MRKLAVIALALWLGAGTVVGGILLLRHAALAVPPPSSDALRAAVATQLPRTGRWGLVHVLYRTCTCSTKTIAYLLERRAVPGVDELVLVVDDAGAPHAEDRQLRDAGFRVSVITPRALRETYQIEAAPVLVVVKPAGSIDYVGGYNRRKQEPRFMDLAILQDAMHQTDVASLPVFGCATSARLANAIDPLGLDERKVER